MRELLPSGAYVSPHSSKIALIPTESRRLKSLAVFSLKVVIVLICLWPSTSLFAQLSGTKTIPGDYATIALAVADLNTMGVGAGGVTFNVAAGHMETLSATISITATGTMANPIIFQKSGGGANPLITAYTGGTATHTTTASPHDGLLNLVGSDYVIIDGIDLLENPANAGAARMEYGYALLKASTTNGCQNNIIRNCTITLDRTNSTTGTVVEADNGATGIWVANTLSTGNASLTITDVAGANSNNQFLANTIQNCNTGIYLRGFISTGQLALYDQNNDVGGSIPQTGNTIINYGGGGVAVPAHAIRAIYQNGFNFSYNNINSNDGSGVNHTSTLRGIFMSTGTSSSGNIDFNTVTLHGGGTTSALAAIECTAGSTAAGNTISMSNNIVQSSTYTTATSGTFTGIDNGGSPAQLLMDGNTVTGNTLGVAGTGTSGTFTGITGLAGAGNTISASNNTVTNNLKNGTSGTMVCLDIGSGLPVIDGNVISDNTFNSTSGSTSANLHGIRNSSSGGTTIVYTNNQVFNLFFTGANTASANGVNGIISSSASTSDKTISNNLIYNLQFTNSSTGSGTVTGINHTTANTTSIFNNKIYDLIASNGLSSVVIGITHGTSTTTCNIYNNLIGNLVNSQASLADAVKGINITNATASAFNNVSYNTVYINASSSGTNFGTSGIFHSGSATATTGTLILRNNIVVNISIPNGTGLTVAYRRSSTSLSNYGSDSNNNLFYAGAPGAANLIFYDGTNADQMLPDFKTRVTPRDANSVTENPPFLSTTGTSANFLHINTASPTQIESGGIAITGISDDFDGVIRQGSGGYAGTGSAPDLGADEGEFMLADLTDPGIAYAPLVFTCATGNRSLNGVTISDASGVPIMGANQARIYYKKSLSGTWVSSQGTLAGGTAVSGSWNFTILSASMGGVTAGDTVYYYVIAQDNAMPINVGSNPGAGLVASDVNTVTTHPTTPNFYTIGGSISGTYQVGAGQDYATLTAAIASYNSNCLGSAVIFELTDASYGAGETFPIVITANPDAGSTNTLTIRPAAATAVTISGTSGATVSSLFQLLGADYVTFDGLNTGGASLTIENTSTTAGTAVIWMSSLGAGAGARNNTVRNVSIKAGVDQSTATTVTYGVVIGGTTLGATATAITAGEDNDNTMIEGNTFTKARYCLFIRGGSALNANTGTVITNNTFGPSAFGAESVGKSGVVIREEDGTLITDNTFQFIGGEYATTTGGSDRVAICLGPDALWPVTTVYVKNAQITGNIIHDIVDERTFAAAGVSIGAADGVNPTNNLVANNFMYNIKANGTASDQAVGIGLSLATNDRVVFNTIYMEGDTDPNASASSPSQANYGISISSTSVVNPLIRNNIVYMDLFSSSAPAVEFACINVPASYDWGTGSSNYNDLRRDPDNAQCYTGSTGGTSGTYYVDLAGWQGAVTQDANSTDAQPVFTSATDMHLLPTANGALNNLGSPVSGITVDIDGDTRNVTTPDMGADEFTTPLGNDVGVIALVSPVNDGCYSATEMVVVTLRNFNPQTLNFSTNNVTVTVTSNTGYNSNVVINSGTLAGGATQNVMLPATIDMSANGTYTFNGNATVATDLYNGNDAMSAVSRIHLSLGGTYEVGAGGDYTTLTSAITDYNAMTCCTGPITFRLTDATYGSETFPIVINHSDIAGTNGLTITPDAGVAAVISGSSSTGGIIDLNGADYVTIDGVNSGGSSLLIRNTSTTIPVIRFINESVNNTLTNTTFEGAITSTTNGIILFSTSASGVLGNSDNTISSCDIRDRSDATGVPGNGIYTSGTTANPNANNVISGNDIFNFNSSGVNLSSTGNGGGWEILDNNIYNAQSTASALTQNGVLIAGGADHVVSGNYIGGNSPGATGTWTNTGNIVLNGVSITGGVANVQNNSIANISCTNTGTTVRLRGISLTSANDGVVIDNNDIYNLSCSGPGATTPYGAGSQPIAGIHSFTGSTFYVTTITNNDIYNLTADNTSALTTSILACGMFLTNFTGVCSNNSIRNIRNLSTGTTAGQPPIACGIYGRYLLSGLVSNNMISLGDGETNNVQYSGVIVSHFGGAVGTTTNIHFYLHNSIRITGTASGSFSSYAFIRGDNSTTSPVMPVTLANNILSMERSGGGSMNYAIASQGTNPDTMFVSNYNDLYSSVASELGYWNATGYNFANWQSTSGGDANSVNVLPVFTSVTDLHVTPANAALNNAGTPIEEVEYDFDDEPRNILTPDLGADEFVATGECSPIVTNTSNSGAGSLRDVITCVPNGTSITFDPSLFGQTITLTSGEIALAKTIGLYGLGKANLTLSGNNTSRIFHLQTGNTLRLNDLALKNGSAMTNGGAIFVEGNLRLNTVLFENNQENGVDKSMTLISPAMLEVLGAVDIND